MHELSLCQDIIDQLTAMAISHHAASVASVTVRIGALSGVEPMLLESAFQSARLDTVAESATLVTEWIPACVKCRDCGTEAEAAPNYLLCPACDSNRTDLVRGDELTLASVELMVPDDVGIPSPVDGHGALVPRGH